MDFSTTTQRDTTPSPNAGSSNATLQKTRLAAQRPPSSAKSKKTNKNGKKTSSSSSSSWASWSKSNHKRKMCRLRRNDLLMKQLLGQLKAAESECFNSLECFHESDSYLDSLECFASADSWALRQTDSDEKSISPEHYNLCLVSTISTDHYQIFLRIGAICTQHHYQRLIFRFAYCTLPSF